MPAKRENPPIGPEREAVVARAHGMCEAGCGRRGTEVHHRKYRSRRGTNHRWNLMLLCDECHDWAHANSGSPADPGEASRLGHTVFSFEDPQEVLIHRRYVIPTGHGVAHDIH